MKHTFNKESFTKEMMENKNCFSKETFGKSHRSSPTKDMDGKSDYKESNLKNNIDLINLNKSAIYKTGLINHLSANIMYVQPKTLPKTSSELQRKPKAKQRIT